MSVKFDEIGKWSELKLEIIEKYAIPYMDIMANNNFKAHYIDGFSGAGIHWSKNRKDLIAGSPLRVLNIKKPFNTYYFFDLNNDKADSLNTFVKKNFPNRNFKVIIKDCNEELMKLLPKFSLKNYDRLFCLLDPYGLHLDWNVIKKMGEMGIVDLILNFPIMDINRNAIWRNPQKIPQDGIDRMTSFWGDETWKKIAYKESSQNDLFNSPSIEKQANEIIAKAFQKRLKEHGKFKYVPSPIPLRNRKKAVIYYLFFASQNKTANKIASDLFMKYGEPI